jgi:hypothetical protein
MMPGDIAERATQAWTVAHRAELKAEASADRATEAYFELIGEVRALRAEGDAREVRVGAWQDAIARQMRALTESVRMVRKSTSNSSDEEIRNELPTLPEIIVEAVKAERRVDSDRAAAAKWRTAQGWIVGGLGKAVKTAIAVVLLAAMGWLAREIVGQKSQASAVTHVK